MNGHRTARAKLDTGDVITIGSTELLFERRLAGVTASARWRSARRSLILKVLFLVLLYFFIWRIVRTASRDLRLPQESFVLTPGQAQAAGSCRPPGQSRPDGWSSSEPDADGGHRARARLAHVVTIGRGAQNDIALDDDFASASHARVEPQRDGVWVSDAGSTNGTFVNGKRSWRNRAGSRPAT